MEKLGPILWFIVIGAIFYFMMKKGGCCGGGDAGKGGSGHEHGNVPDAERKDEKSEHKNKGGCC